MTAIGVEISSGGRPGTMGAYDLPVSIGRADGPESKGSRHIRLDPDNKKISRWHVQVSERGGKYYLLNKAANPGSTRYKGRALSKDEQVEIRLGDAFQIYDHEVRVLPAGTVRVAIGDRKRTNMQQYTLPTGGSILLHARSGLFEVDVLQAGAQLPGERVRNRLAVLFFYDEGQPALAVLSNPEAKQVLLNRAILGQDTIYVRPFEVIEIGDNRIEVLPTRGPVLACTRADCRMLNEYHLDQNCWNCGQHLSNAETVIIR